MQAAIYIQLLDHTGYTYEKPLLPQLKQRLPELILYDFDTQSDRLVIGYGMELLEKADKVVVFIEANESSASVLIAFLEKLLAYQQKCMVVLYGKNHLVDRMLKLLHKDRLVEADFNMPVTEQVIAFLCGNQP
jgi:hypothetical protein